MLKITWIFLLFGCAGKDSVSAISPDDLMAEEVWEEIAPFETWNQMEGWQGIVPSDSVHGEAVSIWLNEIAYDALIAGETVPDGGIVVKEAFSSMEGIQRTSISVMKKTTDYNADGGDWFWASYKDDEPFITMAGSPDFCISCHSSGEDYIVFTSLAIPE
jgi:hypothetical protein